MAVQDAAMAASPPPPDPGDGASGWRSLAVLGFLVLLGLGCVWLANTLRHESQVEDCIASGRRDCDRLVTGR
jgi:hypothetical protein